MAIDLSAQPPPCESATSPSKPVDGSVGEEIVPEPTPENGPATDVRDETIDAMTRIKALRVLDASLYNAAGFIANLKQMVESAASFELGRLHYLLGLNVQQTAVLDPNRYAEFTDKIMVETAAGLTQALADIEAARVYLIEHPPTFEQPAVDPTAASLAEASEQPFGGPRFDNPERFQSQSHPSHRGRYSYGLGHFAQPGQFGYSHQNPYPTSRRWTAPVRENPQPSFVAQGSPDHWQDGDLTLRTAGVAAYGRVLPNGQFMLLAGSFINLRERSQELKFGIIGVGDGNVDRLSDSYGRLRNDLMCVNADVARSVVCGNTVDKAPWTDCDGKPYDFTEPKPNNPQILATRRDTWRTVTKNKPAHPLRLDDLILHIPSGHVAFARILSNGRVLLLAGSYIRLCGSSLDTWTAAIDSGLSVRYSLVEDGVGRLDDDLELADIDKARMVATGTNEGGVRWRYAGSNEEFAVRGEDFTASDEPRAVDEGSYPTEQKKYSLEFQNGHGTFHANCWAGVNGRITLEKDSCLNRMSRDADLELHSMFATGTAYPYNNGIARLTRNIELPITADLKRAAQLVVGKIDTDAEWKSV